MSMPVLTKNQVLKQLNSISLLYLEEHSFLDHLSFLCEPFFRSRPIIQIPNN